MKRQIKGEITVFLSFSLFLVLALVSVMIEGARIKVIHAWIDRALWVGLDSCMSEFYKPLYEDYHLFALDSSYGSASSQYDRIQAEIKNSLEYTFIPTKDLTKGILNKKVKSLNLTSILDYKLELDEMIRFIDEDGIYMLGEIGLYQRNKIDTEFIELILKKLGFVKQMASTTTILAEKLKMEEIVSQVSIGEMDLMSRLDGLTFDKKGVAYNKNNSLKIQTYFMKKFCTTSVTSEQMGINHPFIYGSLRNHYIDVPNRIRQINSGCNTIKQLILQLDSLTINTENMKPEEIEQAIEGLNSQRRSIEREIQVIGEDINKQKRVLVELSEGVRKEVESAISIYEDLTSKQVKARNALEQYETFYKSNKSELMEGVSEGLEEELQTVKKNNMLHSPEEIQKKIELLKENKAILEQVIQLKSYSISQNSIEAYNLESYSNTLSNIVTNYHIKEFQFDYSTFAGKEKVKNPIESLKDLIENGILSLLIDDETKISKKELGQESLLLNKESRIERDIGNSLGNFLDKDYKSEVSESLGEISDIMTFGESLLQMSESVLQRIYLSFYAEEHFKKADFSEQRVNKEEGSLDIKKLETKLEYEQEYLLIGKQLDKENLVSTLNRLLLVRMVLNYIYLLTDTQKSNEAMQTAQLLVGFTGLVPLISLTKTVILFSWAYEEALLDVKALLENKTVPLLKRKEDFLLSYSELLLINKKYIKEKVDKITISNKNEKTDFTYQDYLNCFVFFSNTKKSCYKGLDVIQANIRLRYDETFTITDCFYSVSAKGEYVIPSKFIQLPMIQTLISNDANGYQYKNKVQFAYH